MKIYYFNDLPNSVNVFKYNLLPKNFIKTLDAAQGCVIELDIPEDAIPFIKVWQNIVLITYWEDYEKQTNHT